MKLSTLVFGLPALLLALIIALANRRAVTFSLDPFSSDTPLVAFEVPLYLVLFLALLAGVLIGGMSAWAGQGQARKKARKTAKEVRQLEKDIARRDVEVTAPAQDGLAEQKRLG